MRTGVFARSKLTFLNLHDFDERHGRPIGVRVGEVKLVVRFEARWLPRQSVHLWKQADCVSTRGIPQSGRHRRCGLTWFGLDRVAACIQNFWHFQHCFERPSQQGIDPCGVSSLLKRTLEAVPEMLEIRTRAETLSNPNQVWPQRLRTPDRGVFVEAE